MLIINKQMLPGFNDLKLDSFMPIYEGFKNLDSEKEEFTADEIEKISSEEDTNMLQTTTTEFKTGLAPENNKKNNKQPVNNTPQHTEPHVESEEDNTKEFITKYIESEEPEEPKHNNKPKNNKTTEGFQGSVTEKISKTKLILVTLIIVMVSFILNMDNTRLMVRGWLRNGFKTILCISLSFGLLVYIILNIFI